METVTWSQYRYSSHVLYHSLKLACPRCGCFRQKFDEVYRDEPEKGKIEIAIPMHCPGCGVKWELGIKKGIPDNIEACVLSAEIPKKKGEIG
jgi:uncharacterized Zn finger protein